MQLLRQATFKMDMVVIVVIVALFCFSWKSPQLTRSYCLFWREKDRRFSITQTTGKRNFFRRVEIGDRTSQIFFSLFKFYNPYLWSRYLNLVEQSSKRSTAIQWEASLLLAVDDKKSDALAMIILRLRLLVVVAWWCPQNSSLFLFYINYSFLL